MASKNSVAPALKQPALKPPLTTPRSKPKPAPLRAAKLQAPKPKPAPLRAAKLPVHPTLTSWSYSVYTKYLKCPLSVFFDKVQRIRIPEPPNPAFDKGNTIHKFSEDYIATRIPATTMLPELQAVASRLKAFRKAKASVEQDWAFTKDFQPTRWNDWTNCWLRIKVDVCSVLTPPSGPPPSGPPLVQIVDWKTGRVYDDHRQQRSLYALGGLQLIELGLLANGDKSATVAVEHLYTDTTQSAMETYNMQDLKPLKREWLSRIRQMMSDTTYRPHTGYHCRYCKFRKSAGGPCKEDQ